MSCINPLSFNIIVKGKRKNITVACGHCLNCLIKKQSQLIFLSQKELLTKYQNKQSASFVTLTYDDYHIPYNENGFCTLRKRDVQLFMKNLRRNMEYHNDKTPFKVLYCGEYGDGTHAKNGVSTRRPHYHIAFIGLSESQIKKYTRRLWKNGLCDVGPLSSGGLRYICKYMTKACPDKEIKELREFCDVESPFICHSIGLGKDWIDKNLQNIVDNDFHFNLNGKLVLFPRHVLRYVSAHTGVDYLEYAQKDIYNDTNRKIAKQKGFETIDDYMIEQSYIRYKYKVSALRSQNKPVNDITLSKSWVKPISHSDRSFVDMIDKNIVFTPKGKRFDDLHRNLAIPRKKVWDSKKLRWIITTDWDLYLYGDVVPF